MDSAALFKLMADAVSDQLRAEFRKALMAEAERCVDEVVDAVTKDITTRLRTSYDPVHRETKLEVSFVKGEG